MGMAMEFVNSSGAEGIGLPLLAALMPIFAMITYVILIVVCGFLQSCLNRIPVEHRQMDPNGVWLLLVPCFNIVWIFFVCVKLARSFKSYFDAQNVTDVGNGGYSLSLVYCVSTWVATFLICVMPIPGIMPIAAAVLRMADGHPHEAGLWFAALILMFVNVINPIPVVKFLFLLWAPSGGSWLVPGALAVLLIVTVVRFVKLRNRIRKST